MSSHGGTQTLNLKMEVHLRAKINRWPTKVTALTAAILGDHVINKDYQRVKLR